MPPLAPSPAEFRATVRRVIDGDTLEIEATIFESRTFTDIKRFRLRLLGINAPEMKGATHTAGEAARLYLDSLIQQCTGGLLVRMGSIVDSFGRVVGELVGRMDDEHGGSEVVNLGQRMLATGHAREYRAD